jgi:hypothetical protein
MIHFIPSRRSGQHYFSYRERIRVPASLRSMKGTAPCAILTGIVQPSLNGATMKKIVAMLMFTALGCHASGAIARITASSSDIPPTHIPHVASGEF